MDHRHERAVDRRGHADLFTFTHHGTGDEVDLGLAALLQALQQRRLEIAGQALTRELPRSLGRIVGGLHTQRCSHIQTLLHSGKGRFTNERLVVDVLVRQARYSAHRARCNIHQQLIPDNALYVAGYGTLHARPVEHVGNRLHARGRTSIKLSDNRALPRDVRLHSARFEQHTADIGLAADNVLRTERIYQQLVAAHAVL